MSSNASVDSRDQALVVKGQLRAMELWFLMFKDASTDINPLFIRSAELSSHGFQKLLDVNGISLDLIIRKASEKLNKIEIVAIVQEVIYESSARSISYLSNHFSHVNNSISPPEPIKKP